MAEKQKIPAKNSRDFEDYPQNNASSSVLDASDQIDEAIDDTLQLERIVALRHHPDQRFGSRRTNHQPATSRKFAFGIRDRIANNRIFKRLAAFEADILEQLRSGLETAADFAHCLGNPG